MRQCKLKMMSGESERDQIRENGLLKVETGWGNSERLGASNIRVDSEDIRWEKIKQSGASRNGIGQHGIGCDKSKRNRAVLEWVGGLKQQFQSLHPPNYLYLTRLKNVQRTGPLASTLNVWELTCLQWDIWAYISEFHDPRSARWALSEGDPAQTGVPAMGPLVPAARPRPMQPKNNLLIFYGGDYSPWNKVAN